MSDALLSVPVGITFWGVTAVTIGVANRRLKKEFEDERIVPMMGVLGAFVFALQMVNFTIPFTGSSGHFAGGFFLALVLGSNASFLVITSVLIIQALFFADGGLLALGCNIFNMGFIPSYVILPLIKKLTKDTINPLTIWLGAYVSLILGAAMVAVEVALSKVTELPFDKMFFVMVGIHAIIGIVEGFITLGGYKLLRTFEDIVESNNKKSLLRGVYLPVLFISFIIAGIVALFASKKPDGLEWSIYNLLGNYHEPSSTLTALHSVFDALQKKVAIFPDYTFGNHLFMGNSIAGIIGALFVVAFAFAIGFFLRKKRDS
jgi:cobalt/nickel transport system permease protein